MKEILTQLFGEAVTDEALKTFNAELGKKFVAKADFNAKGEEIKTLKAEKQSLENEIAKLNETAKGGEDVKAELEALKAQIESDKKQAEADRIMREKTESIKARFAKANEGKGEWYNDFTENGYLDLFSKALEDEKYSGMSDVDILHELSKNDPNARKGVTVVKLAGGTARPTGKVYTTKEEIRAIKDNDERLKAIRENPQLYRKE